MRHPAREVVRSNAPATRTLALVLAALILLALGLLAGCASQAKTTGTAPTGGAGSTGTAAGQALLQSTNWVASDIAGPDGKLAPVVTDSTITANFSRNTIEGSGGVNRYTATYELNGVNGIVITVGATTQMAGPPALMTQETAYLQALGRSVKYLVSSTQLQLLNASGAVLVSYTPGKSLTLTGQPWYCTGYNNGKQAVVSLEPSSEITAVFGADGTLQGNAGINDYLTHYTVSGTLMHINPSITSTLKAGPEPLMQQETLYLQALKTVTSYKINSDGTLDLFDKSGARQAQYSTTKP